MVHGAWCMPHAAWRAVNSLNAPRSRDGEARRAVPGSQQADLSHPAQTNRVLTTGEIDESKKDDGAGGEVRGRGSTALDLSPASWFAIVTGTHSRLLEGPC